MRRAKAGSIINMGSVRWMAASRSMPAYTAAKSVLSGLTRNLGGDGIRMNEIVSRWVFTEGQESLWAAPEAVERHMLKQCRKPKVVPPDIARMALWLTADDSRMVTTQNFIVDGGDVSVLTRSSF